MPRHNLRRGALYMLAAAFLFACTAALVRSAAAAGLPNEMVVFFRNGFGLLALLPLLIRGGWRGLKTRRFNGHLWRTLFGLGAMYCYFYALAHMPLAEVTLFNHTTPLFMPLIASLWLGEHVPRRLWGPILTGFAGLLLILKPGAELFTPVSLLALASGVLAAFAMVTIRHLTTSEPALRVVFYFTLISTLISAVPLSWAWQTPPPGLWGVLLLIGATASAAQLFLTRAHASAPSAEVGPFTYSIVVFSGLIGWLAWGEAPDGLSLAGIALVCAAGIAVLRLAGRNYS